MSQLGSTENIYIRSGVFYECFFTDVKANLKKIG